MKLLTAQQIRDWDAYTIAHEPVTSVDLMERAAGHFTRQFLTDFHLSVKADKRLRILVVCGQGNNGGDGLVAARLLHACGYNPVVAVVRQREKGSDDFETNLLRLASQGIEPLSIDKASDLSLLADSDFIIEALTGTGLSKPLEGLFASVIRHLNALKGTKVSIDIPAGLGADFSSMDFSGRSEVFEADYTYTFQVLKQSFLLPETGKFAGEVKVLDIGLHKDFMASISEFPYLMDSSWKPESGISESRFDHKWNKGHALLVAGSFGMAGAALLSGRAALRAGCGMVTLHVPRVAYTIIQTAFPEALVQADEELYEIRNFPDPIKYQSIGAGPGLGRHPLMVKAFGNWIRRIHSPIVIDADGLNACADLMKSDPTFSFPSNAVLTPHVKEFDRMFGESSNSYLRLLKQQQMSRHYKVVIALKGAHTSITTPDGKLFFNATGNRLLGTAGSGDVLTGIITALLAKGFDPQTAACFGVNLHGKLADQLKENGYKNALASDLISLLAYQD